jgi:GNAT superfamily N-acetyltransferase
MNKIVVYKDVKDLEYLVDACRIHNRAFPFDNVECDIFNSFIFNDVNLDEELILLILDSFGKVRGFIVGVEIVREPSEAIDKFKDVIWVKDLAIDSNLSQDDWRNIFNTLLKEFENIARERSKKGIVLYAYPPYYFMPGINVLYEDYIEIFEIHNYYKKEETVNYEINLSQFFYPKRVLKLENKLISEGIIFRKGRDEEAEIVSQWVGKTFESPFWRIESLYAFRNKPPTIWITEQGSELIGFSVYLRMGRNEFGPIGVDPKKRRHGVGTVLLFKALNDLKELGFRYAVIPWTSHLFFYTQVPGIEKIKHYYIMVKNL